MSSTVQKEENEKKVGVYICHCGGNISDHVDVERLADEVRRIPGVTAVHTNMFMCSDPGQELIQQDIKEHKLNRIVVASCSPLLHEQTFRTATQRGGINPFYFHMVNIREHDSWVHTDKQEATEKAKALAHAAIQRVAHHQALETKRVEVHPDVLVLGGGIAGIHAALTLANAGKKVYLVEREPSIGGHMAKFDKTFPTLDCAACILTPKMSDVGAHPNITLWSYSEVTGVDGPGKLDVMRELGADHVIDFTGEDFTRSGEQYDLILDVVCHRSVADYRRALGPGGRCGVIGGSTGRLVGAVALGQASMEGAK